MYSGKRITPKPASTLLENSSPASPTSTTFPVNGRAAMPIAALPIDNPHELLGLVAGEENIRVIIEAARSRLMRIREANGSEVAVRAFVIGQICRARAAMLKEARRAAASRNRDGERRSSGLAANASTVRDSAVRDSAVRDSATMSTGWKSTG